MRLCDRWTPPSTIRAHLRRIAIDVVRVLDASRNSPDRIGLLIHNDDVAEIPIDAAEGLAFDLVPASFPALAARRRWRLNRPWVFCVVANSFVAAFALDESDLAADGAEGCS